MLGEKFCRLMRLSVFAFNCGFVFMGRFMMNMVVGLCLCV